MWDHRIIGELAAAVNGSERVTIETIGIYRAPRRTVSSDTVLADGPGATRRSGSR